VLEAMACGCPVITGSNSSLPEVGGAAALYVDALNTEELAAALHHVATDEGQRQTMRDQGLEQARRFAWRYTAEQTLAVYQSAVAGHGP